MLFTFIHTHHPIGMPGHIDPSKSADKVHKFLKAVAYRAHLKRRDAENGAQIGVMSLNTRFVSMCGNICRGSLYSAESFDKTLTCQRLSAGRKEGEEMAASTISARF